MSCLVRILGKQLTNTTNSSHVSKVFMSQYPKYYVQPIFRKSQLEELQQSGELSKLAHVPTRAALLDQTCSVFFDPLVNKFTNYVMGEGKKLLARTQMEKTFEQIKRIQIEKYHKTSEEHKDKIILDPKVIFHQAVENCKPIMHLTPIKRGGVTYQVPVPILEKKALFMSMKWLIEAGKEKDAEVRFYFKLAHELIDASNNTGKVIKRKQDLHRQCEANRAYAHYRWS